jgi:thermolysin
VRYAGPALAGLVILAGHLGLAGQQTATPRLRSVAASGAALQAWASRAEVMLRDGTLDIGRVQEDTMIPGRAHERLVQHHQGVPIFGAELIRQIEGGRPVSVFGQLFEDVALPTTTPSLAPGAAAALAERAVGAGASAGQTTLGILPLADRFVLVYRTTVRSAWDVRVVSVNAVTGAIEQSRSRIRHQAPTIGEGTGVLGDRKKVSGVQSSSVYQATDRRRPATAFTLDFRGSVTRLNAFLQTGVVFLSDVASSSSNTWTDGAVVDAHVYEGWVYDYFFKRYGRRGIDDRNLEIVSIVHPLARSDAGRYPPDVVGTYINNASYFGDGFMIYGDGDGSRFNYFAGALDVVAHELTHGVTDFSSGLEYHDEPGALNEAFSDIMAVGTEYFHQRPGQGPQRGPNYLIAEDVTRVAPGYIRSLQNPMALGDPDHYSLRQFIGTPIDDGGVHINSLIAGHAFYLAVAGGRNRVSGITVAGIGQANSERMERIFYRAFAFLLGPRSQFADARAATLQAAAELFGGSSNERAQIAQAWTAVGVN